MKRLLVTGGSGFIGTNCVTEAVQRGWDLVTLDTREPLNPAHAPYWRRVDIRDRGSVSALMREFRPTHIVHLAAKKGMDEKHISEFSANIEGVDHLLSAAKEAGTVKRSIVVSSLLVCRNGYVPTNDTDYCPPNLYGQSKVETERHTRSTDPAELPWVIVRPTSVWGPWFDGGYRQFFELIQKGSYIHLGGQEIVKPLTFVGNAVHVMLTMLTAPGEKLIGRTFYLADWPERSVREWAEIIRAAFGAPPIRTLPLSLMRMVAVGGDILKLVGIPEPPLTSFRLNNMLTGAHYPWERTAEVVGELPFSLEDGVRSTVDWLSARRTLLAA